MRLWIWNNIHIEVPDDWEMLLFSRNPVKGRCTFGDRDAYRMQIHWRPLQGEPDLPRMIQDYQGELEKDDSVRAVTPQRHGCWRGLSYRKAGLPMSRHTCYFPDCRGLLEVVFPPVEHALEVPVERILNALKWITSHADSVNLRRWMAFGMEWFSPSDLALNTCEVHPGSTRVRFGDARRGSSECFVRLGMVHRWLAGTVAEWLRHQTDNQWTIRREDRFDVSGHQINSLEGVVPNPKKLRLRRGTPVCFRAAAWTCPADGRIYHHESVFPEGADPDAGHGHGQRPGHRLLCCATLGGCHV